MSQPLESFIKTQALICAILNMVLNPTLAWMLNPSMADVPMIGGNGLVVDTAVTCVLLSVLVSLFTTAGLARALRTGQIPEDCSLPGAGPLLSLMPRGAWALGLTLGIGLAAILPAVAFGIFWTIGVSSMPFAGFALYKCLYTGALGYAATRWVILRQVQPTREDG